MITKVEINVNDFVKTINELKKESGRSSEEMLQYVMILMLQAGRSATPLGRKNRSLVTQDSEVETAGDLGLKADYGKEQTTEKVRFFRVYKQGSHVPKKVFVPRIPRKTRNNEAERSDAIRARDAIVAQFKQIPFRGIAKASWGWAMKAVSKKARPGAGDDALSAKMRKNPIQVTRQNSENLKSIEVTNRLGWILKISPGIEQRMMSSAEARMRHELQRIFLRGIERAQRRAS